MITIMSHLQSTWWSASPAPILIFWPITGIMPTMLVMVRGSHLAFANAGSHHPNCYQEPSSITASIQYNQLWPIKVRQHPALY